MREFRSIPVSSPAQEDISHIHIQHDQRIQQQKSQEEHHKQHSVGRSGFHQPDILNSKLSGSVVVCVDVYFIRFQTACHIDLTGAFCSPGIQGKLVFQQFSVDFSITCNVNLIYAVVIRVIRHIIAISTGCHGKPLISSQGPLILLLPSTE